MRALRGAIGVKALPVCPVDEQDYGVSAVGPINDHEQRTCLSGLWMSAGQQGPGALKGPG